ncbi:MAG: tyrosine-type recombinase/integrase [Phycisphaeraceae bacterium]
MALLPYPEFALSPHMASGRWYKVYEGRRHYFGKLADGWEAAYKRYEDEWPQIVAGRKPRPDADTEGGGLTLREGVNKWLAARVEDGQYGNIAASTVEAYRSIGTRLIKELGGTTRIGWLGPDDFRRLGLVYGSTMGPSPSLKAMIVTRQVFKWLHENEYIPAPPRYGSDFKVSKLKAKQIINRGRSKEIYTAEQVRAILRVAEAGVKGKRWKKGEDQPKGIKASPHLRAMILLAINGGYTQRELAALRLEHVDMPNAIIDHYRGKTETRRVVPLWPETVEAIKASIAERPEPRADAGGLLFVTRKGLAWVRDNIRADEPDESGKANLTYRRVDSINLQFRKLCTGAGVEVDGAGFGRLRHTHRTVSDGANDSNAARRIMGHDAKGIDSRYIVGHDRDRLQAVVEHVRQWLYADASTKPSKAKGDAKGGSKAKAAEKGTRAKRGAKAGAR